MGINISHHFGTQITYNINNSTVKIENKDVEYCSTYVQQCHKDSAKTDPSMATIVGKNLKDCAKASTGNYLADNELENQPLDVETASEIGTVQCDWVTPVYFLALFWSLHSLLSFPGWKSLENWKGKLQCVLNVLFVLCVFMGDIGQLWQLQKKEMDRESLHYLIGILSILATAVFHFYGWRLLGWKKHKLLAVKKKLRQTARGSVGNELVKFAGRITVASLIEILLFAAVSIYAAHVGSSTTPVMPLIASTALVTSTSDVVTSTTHTVVNTTESFNASTGNSATVPPLFTSTFTVVSTFDVIAPTAPTIIDSTELFSASTKYSTNNSTSVSSDNTSVGPWRYCLIFFRLFGNLLENVLRDLGLTLAFGMFKLCDLVHQDIKIDLESKRKGKRDIPWENYKKLQKLSNRIDKRLCYFFYFLHAINVSYVVSLVCAEYDLILAGNWYLVIDNCITVVKITFIYYWTIKISSINSDMIYWDYEVCPGPTMDVIDTQGTKRAQLREEIIRNPVQLGGINIHVLLKIVPGPGSFIPK